MRRARQALLVALLAGLSLWSQALDRDRLLEVAAGRSAKALAGARALVQMLEKAQAQALDEEGRLAAVNDFFNRRIQFRDDQEVWGAVDYWASPLEILEKGRGDCEDYAIAKMSLLAALGFRPEQLQFIVLK
ncbi:MAG TPA: transglutaminase-like cysteine peptidase, partial [Burkholderiaceae bacterium]|nr:transglutaminase-like cysteine peptidase [Burkholderiaceae bacterium]